MVFHKGQSGNPGGRPKRGETISDALARSLTKQQLARKVAQLVKAGDMAAIRFYAERTEGKVPDQVKLEQTGETTIRVVREERKHG